MASLHCFCLLAVSNETISLSLLGKSVTNICNFITPSFPEAVAEKLFAVTLIQEDKTFETKLKSFTI